MSQSIRINNWIASLMFLFPFRNGAIGIAGASLFTLSIITVLFLISLYYNKYRISYWGITLCLIISIIFIVSLLRMDQMNYTFNYMTYFLVYNVIALFVGMLRIDINKVINYTVVMGTVGTLIYWARGTVYENTGIQMGTAYAMLGVLFSSTAAIFIGSKYRVLAIINCLLVFFLHVKSAPRGIWLSIGFYIGFLAFYMLTKRLNYAKGMLVKILLLSVAAVVICGFMTDMEQILLGINDFLIQKFGIEVYALWKFSFYLRKGDLFNGRSEIWDSAITSIREGGVLGNGIGYFESIMEGSHAHNIVLQMLCEAGIPFLIPLGYMLVKSIYILIIMTNRADNKEYIYFLLLFSYGVVMLFYSSTYWLWVPFWFFVGYFISYEKKKITINRGNRI